MAEHGVCPWWIGWLLASPVRRLMQDPAARAVAPLVRAGMTVLEPGPGMGFFTLEIARRVGSSGRVVAVDVQPRMIAGLLRRARRAGLCERIDARVVPPGSMGLGDLEGAVDVVFAFAVVHEMPAPGPFFSEAAVAMKTGARLLLAEPSGHVDAAEFAGQLAAAARSGLTVAGIPPLRGCRTALLSKAAP